MKKKIISLIAAAALMLSAMTSCRVTLVMGNGDEENKAVPAEKKEIEIDDDIFSYQISIDGKLYSLPCKLSEFIAGGWVIDTDTYAYADSSGQLTSMDHDFVALDKGDNSLAAYVINTSSETQAYEDCVLWRFGIYGNFMETMNVVLPKNLIVDSSLKIDDVISVYGEPDERNERYFIKLYYYDKSIPESEVRNYTSKGVYEFWFDLDGEFYQLVVEMPVSMKGED